MSEQKYLYAIALKPVITAGGIDVLDPSKKLMFEGVLAFMSKFIEAANEVDKARILPDYSIIVVANEEVYDKLAMLAKNAIVTRLDPNSVDVSEL